jgi:iron complex outermembrane receptor protein
MQFQQKKVAAALAHSLGGTALIAGIPAEAQDIVRYVTGSNIPRTETEGALTVQIITREQVEREGLLTANDVVARLSSSSSL